MATVRIFLTGKMQGNSEIEWRISPPPTQDEPADAELQRLIDEGEQTAELLDDMEDRAFWAKGEW